MDSMSGLRGKKGGVSGTEKRERECTSEARHWQRANNKVLSSMPDRVDTKTDLLLPVDEIGDRMRHHCSKVAISFDQGRYGEESPWLGAGKSSRRGAR